MNTREVQEWLTLHGFPVTIDGVAGPATDAAVRAFQTATGLAADGIVGNETAGALLLPITRATAPLAVVPSTYGVAVVAVAQQHAAQKPREVGGENCGPWVRLYMGGLEGASEPWCAGYVSYVLLQAATLFGVSAPVQSYSCTSLGLQARRAGKLLLAEDRAAQGVRVPAGSVMLIRKDVGVYEHTGIVLADNGESIDTLEGNTNSDGSREGYECIPRTRGLANKDFILL